MAGHEQIAQLIERLDRDSEFATALEADPFSTLRSAGFGDLLVAAEQERDRIAELVDRIYRDDVFRCAVEEDPSGKLGDWGLPEVAIEPLLLIAGAPDEVVERAAADVEAHLSVRKPVTVGAVAAVLGAFAFAQQASAATSPATATQVKPAATAQVNEPAATAQVSRAVASAQVRRAAARAQVRPARVAWQGVNAQRVHLQGNLASLLRAHATGL